MPELLEYRDGREPADVDPVLIERTQDRVRIVVRYPRKARVWARNRFLITTAVVLGLAGTTWWMATRRPNPITGIIGSTWILWPALTLMTGVLWHRATWIYVFETDASGLKLETRGRFWTQRDTYPRAGITDVSIWRDRRDRASGIRFKTKYRELKWHWLDGVDEQYLAPVVKALREGLGLDEPAGP